MEYISFLTELYSQKKNSNPKYSKRAFAKDLGIDQGFLSHLLNGKRKLSLQKAHEISENLDLPLRSANQFIGLVRAAHISDPEKKEKLLASLNKSSIDKKTLSQSAFAVISNWYYYAILEMTFKKDFSSNTSDIAKKLGISVLEAELAIERLQNLGLLTKDAQGKWQKSKGNISDLEIASRPGTDRHVQILNKASKAIREQDFNMREFHSVTFCIDKSFLPDAKEKIRHFLEDMNLLLESGAREEVYELSVALFSLEKN